MIVLNNFSWLVISGRDYIEMHPAQFAMAVSRRCAVMVVLSVRPFSGYYPACCECKSKLRRTMNNQGTENDSWCDSR